MPDVTPLRDLQPALPRAVALRRRQLGHGWTARVVFGAGSVPITTLGPAITERDLPSGRTGRPRVVVETAVGSVTLRARRDDGALAVALWMYRIDLETWSFVAAWTWTSGLPVPVTAASFAAYTSTDRNPS